MAITDRHEIDAALGVQHHFSHKVYAKQVLLKRGMSVEQHVHAYDHLSILASGRVEVTVDGRTSVRHAGDCINIKAGSAHQIFALEDCIWFCVHGTDETDPDKVDEVILKG